MKNGVANLVGREQKDVSARRVHLVTLSRMDGLLLDSLYLQWFELLIEHLALSWAHERQGQSYARKHLPDPSPHFRGLVGVLVSSCEINIATELTLLPQVSSEDLNQADL